MDGELFMSIDQESHELGRLAGALEAVASGVKRLEVELKEHSLYMSTRFDNSSRDHEKLLVEMRTLKHDQRNIEQKVEAVDFRIGKVEDNTLKKFTEVDQQVVKIITWQEKMVARITAFGMVGAVVGWIIVNLFAPLVIAAITGGKR